MIVKMAGDIARERPGNIETRTPKRVWGYRFLARHKEALSTMSDSLGPRNPRNYLTEEEESTLLSKLCRLEKPRCGVVAEMACEIARKRSVNSEIKKPSEKWGSTFVAKHSEVLKDIKSWQNFFARNTLDPLIS